MARKIKEHKAIDIEEIVEECFKRIGVANAKQEQIALFSRLLFSGISRYFFLHPDNAVNLGYLRFSKSPDIDELFRVHIVRNGKVGIVNADTLWKYYKGDIIHREKIEEVVNNFVNELLVYSQQQEQDISKLTRKLEH